MSQPTTEIEGLEQNLKLTLLMAGGGFDKPIEALKQAVQTFDKLQNLWLVGLGAQGYLYAFARCSGGRWPA